MTMKQILSGQIDEMGYIALPPELRRAMGWKRDIPLEFCIDMQAQEIVMRVPCTSCICCGTPHALAQFHGRRLCRHCLQELAAL